jgi:hypothetical protein
MNLGNNIRNSVARTLVLVVAPLCTTALWARELRPNPGQLIQEVIENELKAETADHSSWRYLEQREEEKKSEVRQVVGTPDGYVYRILAVNGEVPNSQAECRRVTKLLSDPAELEHAWQAQQHDAEKLRSLMRMLPDAFLYRYDQEQLPGGRVRMSFEPNPDFHPTTTSAEILRHLEGFVVVDTQAKRLTEINARLISSAKFGGGILGHLESGGTVVLRQDDVGDGHWQPVFVDVNMHGRVLFLSLSLHQQISHTEYERLPDTLVPKQIISLITKDSNAENAELR